MKFALLLGAVWLAAPFASAQTVSVGPLGGGAPYQQLQPAIDALPPGATILIEPGVYAPFVLTKAIDILGAGSSLVTIQAPVPDEFSFKIQNIPVGAQLIVGGFSTSGGWSSCVISQQNPGPCKSPIQIENCDGSVTLADIRAGYDPAMFFFGSPDIMSIAFCSSLQLIDCDLKGTGFNEIGVSERAGRALWITDSTVRISGCSIEGGSGYNSPYFSGGGGAEAIYIFNSTVTVSRSTLIGGDGGVTYSAFPPHYYFPGRPAIKSESSSLTLYGGAPVLPGEAPKIRGGQTYCGSPQLPTAAIVASAGTWITADMGLDIIGGPPVCPGGPSGDPYFLTSSSLTQLPYALPVLGSVAVSAPPGGAIKLLGSGESGSSLVFFWSPSLAPPLPLAGFASKPVLDLAQASWIGTQTIDALGQASLTLGVPLVPGLVGSSVYLQAAQVGGTAALTNGWLATIQ